MRVSTLRLALLAAVGLHLVAAAGWQWQRRGQSAAPLLRAADDTPLLLQFSRQESLEATPLSVPLPVGPLPPPPPASTGPLPAAAGAGAGLGRGASPSGLPSPSRRAGIPGNTAAPTAGVRSPQLEPGSPARLALEKALQEEASAAAGGSGGPAAQGGPAATPTGRSGEATSGRGEDRNSRPGESGTAADTSSTGGGDGTGPGSPAAVSEQRLWGLAREVPLPQGRSEGLPEGFALRRLPLDLARRSGARPVHLARTRSGDRLVLLWIEGSTLWLLSAPVPGAPG